MQAYLNLMRDVLENGVPKTDRTGVGTISVEGREMRFDIRGNRLPAVTTRQVPLKGGVAEDLWMLCGDTDIAALKSLDVHFWDKWVKPGTEAYGLRTWLELDREVKAKGGADALTAWKEATIKHRQLAEKRYPLVPLAQTEPWDHAAEALIKELDLNTIGLTDGKLGPVYGYQWRNWEDTRIVTATDWEDRRDFYEDRGYEYQGELFNPDCPEDKVVIHRDIDQVAKVVHSLRTNPKGRRHILSNWNVADLEDMALEPCHYSFQLLPAPMTQFERLDWVREQGHGGTEEAKLEDPEVIAGYLDECQAPLYRLTGKITMRSSDVPVGLPTNLIGYAALTMMFAKVCGMVPHELIWSGGDVHIYTDQIELAKEQVQREPLEQTTYLLINPDVQEMDDFRMSDFKVVGYKSHPPIVYPVAV